MDDKFDQVIKDKLAKEVGSIPRGIDDNIDITLNSLKKKSNKRALLKVASILIIAVLVIKTLGVTVTAMAVGLPVKDAIFESFGMSNYESYASDINVSKKSNGVEITITSAIFDGYKLTIAYSIRSDESMINEGSDFMLLQSCIKINGKESTVSGDGTLNAVTDKYVTGIATFDLYSSHNKNGVARVLGINSLDVLDTLNFVIERNVNIDGKQYSWSFDIPISSEKMKKEIIEYNINKKIDRTKIKKVVITPLNIYVFGSFKRQDKLDINGDTPRIIIIDDKENKHDIYVKSVSANGLSHFLSLGTKGEFVMEYKNLQDCEHIRLVVEGNQDNPIEIDLNKINR